MNEELLIKVKVDTSSVTTSINSLKNQVANVNKTISTTSTASSASASTAKQAQQATGKLSQNIQKLVQGIQKLKNIGSLTDVLEIGAEFGAAAVQAKTVTKAVEKVEDAMEGVSDETKEWIAQLREAVALTRASGQDTSYTYARGGRNNSELIRADDVATSERLLAKYGKTMGSTAGDAADLADNVDDVAVATGAAGATAGTTSGALSGLGATMGSLIAIAAALIPVFIMVGTVIAGVSAALKRSKIGAEIYHSSQQFGFSAKAFQEWSYVMERNGSTIEDLRGFLETLASEQAAVINGSADAAKAFQELGLSAQQVAGMDQQRLFEEVVTRLQNITDATKKSAIAYELFGDEASRLMNVLNMTNAEMQKVLDNYNLLGGSMSDDLIEKSTSLDNALANLRQAWQGISNTLAEAFIPVIKPVVEWLTKAVVWLNLFLRTMFGLDLKSQSGNLGSAAGSANKYAGGLNAATKAANELRRVTMGFDELNIVGNPNSGAGASTGASSLDTSGMAGLDTSMLDAADLNLDKIYEWFEEYKNVIQQVVTWSLIAIGVILAVIGGFTGNIPLLILGIGMAGLGISVGITSGAFERIGESIKKWFNSMKSWFKEHVAPVFTKEFWSEKWNKIVESTSEKVENIKEKINEKWTGIKNWFKEHVAPIFTKKYWSDKFDNIKNSANEKLTETKNAFSEKWNGIKTWFSTNVGTKFTKKYWSDKFNTMKEGASNKIEEVKTALSNGWGGIKKWFSTNVANKFTISYWKEKFQSIPNGIKESFNGAIGIVEKAINAIIKKINTLSWEVPDWVPAIGGSKWGFNFKTVSIPRLATGGITTGSTIANIGENGREAVLPLENNTQWMDTLADKIAARNSSPSKIVLNVDGKELGWATINSINGITEQTGSIQLSL